MSDQVRIINQELDKQCAELIQAKERLDKLLQAETSLCHRLRDLRKQLNTQRDIVAHQETAISRLMDELPFTQASPLSTKSDDEDLPEIEFLTQS